MRFYQRDRPGAARRTRGKRASPPDRQPSNFLNCCTQGTASAGPVGYSSSHKRRFCMDFRGFNHETLYRLRDHRFGHDWPRRLLRSPRESRCRRAVEARLKFDDEVALQSISPANAKPRSGTPWPGLFHACRAALRRKKATAPRPPKIRLSAAAQGPSWVQEARKPPVSRVPASRRLYFFEPKRGLNVTAFPGKGDIVVDRIDRKKRGTNHASVHRLCYHHLSNHRPRRLLRSSRESRCR